MFFRIWESFQLEWVYGGENRDEGERRAVNPWWENVNGECGPRSRDDFMSVRGRDRTSPKSERGGRW